MPFDGTEFSRPLLRWPIAPSATPEPQAKGLQQRIMAFLVRTGGDRVRAFLPGQAADLPQQSVVDLLESARGLIESEEKWIRGSYWKPGGRHCAIGALRAAAGRVYRKATRQRAHELLRDVARERGFCGPDAVERMNDRSSHAEVLSAFDQAIAAARLACVA